MTAVAPVPVILYSPRKTGVARFRSRSALIKFVNTAASIRMRRCSILQRKKRAAQKLQRRRQNRSGPGGTMLPYLNLPSQPRALRCNLRLKRIVKLKLLRNTSRRRHMLLKMRRSIRRRSLRATNVRRLPRFLGSAAQFARSSNFRDSRRGTESWLSPSPINCVSLRPLMSSRLLLLLT